MIFYQMTEFSNYAWILQKLQIRFHLVILIKIKSYNKKKFHKAGPNALKREKIYNNIKVLLKHVHNIKG